MKKEDQLRAEALLKKCRKLLKEEGISASDNIGELTVNPRIRSRFGSCRKLADRSFRIELSSRILEGSDRDVETVLLHELLHTCPRCMNHGKL